MNVRSTTIKGLAIEGFEQDPIFQTIYTTTDFYESDILNMWTPRLGEPKVIFDIGANLGNHTLFWAHKLFPDKIYSFESFNLTFERLQNNVSNNVLKMVIPIYCSVGAEDEENHESDPRIKIIDIDSFVGDEKIKNVDFIKIDAKGRELSVLDGMQSLINRDHPDLWIKVSEGSCSEIMEMLISEGYKAVDVEGSNILFLHSVRHDNILSFDPQKLMLRTFHYLNEINACGLKNQQYVSFIKDLVSQNDSNVSLLLKAQNEIKRLQVQTTYLKRENDEFRRKLSSITDKWYGRIALTCYKFLKRIKHKIIKK